MFVRFFGKRDGLLCPYPKYLKIFREIGTDRVGDVQYIRLKAIALATFRYIPGQMVGGSRKTVVLVDPEAKELQVVPLGYRDGDRHALPYKCHPGLREVQHLLDCITTTMGLLAHRGHWGTRIFLPSVNLEFGTQWPPVQPTIYI